MARVFKRRTFLQMAGMGAASAAAAALLSGCDTPSAQPGHPTPHPPAEGGPVDLHLRLRAAPAQPRILPGSATRVLSYSGEVLQGEPTALETHPGSYLGPTIRVYRGQRVRVELHNQLAEQTIIHWHGLHVPEEMDGHPHYAIGPDQTYTYEFTVINRAGTYWYHPHPHTLTGPQVYRGLAGLLVVSDDEEQALDLPRGEFDVSLVIQDRTFDRDNQLLYLPNGMMDRMTGALGDRILVNGKPEARLAVARRSYRLRLLNGSNSRIYKLAWDDATPLTVIGTDGGLLDRPAQRPYVTLGPAERVELWVDFRQWPLGSNLRLHSLPFSGTTVAGMGMGAFSPLAQGALIPVLTVDIQRDASETSALPSRLASTPHYDEADSVNRNNPRRWALAMSGMTWTINGRVFDMDGVARDEIVRLGNQETWLMDNAQPAGGMGMMGGMQMAHPMHIHGLQFLIVQRTVARGYESDWRTVSDGYVDEGWKDTLLVMPGEQARLLLRFDDYAGMYLLHCHILEHEDMGMMRNYRVDR